MGFGQGRMYTEHATTSEVEKLFLINPPLKNKQSKAIYIENRITETKKVMTKYYRPPGKSS